MLSSEDLERLIAAKKREIQKEKVQLGLVSPNDSTAQDSEKNIENRAETKLVEFKDLDNPKINVLAEYNDADNKQKTELQDYDVPIPADIERYIRRYVGLPVMLKAGEFSPNNPLVRGDRQHGVCGDALLGLGEYERRRNTLRKIRQAQYREYLDRQAKKKQEAKEEAERERREHEQKEREREERERQLLLERERYSPERRRSVSYVPQQYGTVQNNKVDSAIQVDGLSRPLSVAVQTDDAEMYRLSPSPCKLTQAERELSPRTVAEPRDAAWNKWEACERRRSYGDFDERTSAIKKTNRDKLHSDLRHSYMPSIFDADAIQMRNLQVEKDAAERRQFYQQELKNQIKEQQRIREERKSREKLLEQAEMRRLEEQLRMLRVAQEREIDKQHDITAAIKDNAREYESKRTELQRDIDKETQKLRASSHPTRNLPKRPTNTSNSDSQKLPYYYQNNKSFQPIEKKPYSFNIPDNSIFSSNYDVDSYLRKNLNFKNKHGVELFNNNDRDDKEPIINVKDIRNLASERENFKKKHDVEMFNNNERDNMNSMKANTKDIRNLTSDKEDTRKYVVEKALIHEPKERKPIEKPATMIYDANLSVPVLRHSPKKHTEINDISPLSDAMKQVDDKWKVPAVQKNILKSLPNEDGRNVSILTQLGSIRRQLQLEQLKLDRMLNKNE